MGRSVEVAALRADGTEVPVELSLATWIVAGNRFFGAVIRDITERKHADEQLRVAHQELASKSQLLEEKTQQLEALSAKLAKYLSRQL